MIPFAIPAMSRLAKIAIGVGGALILIAGLWLWLSAAERADDKANQEIGATKAVNAGQQTTLKQVGAAHGAGNEIRSSTGSARYDECLRSSAEGYAGFCERYRPKQSVPD